VVSQERLDSGHLQYACAGSTCLQDVLSSSGYHQEWRLMSARTTRQSTTGFDSAAVHRLESLTSPVAAATATAGLQQHQQPQELHRSAPGDHLARALTFAGVNAADDDAGEPEGTAAASAFAPGAEIPWGMEKAGSFAFVQQIGADNGQDAEDLAALQAQLQLAEVRTMHTAASTSNAQQCDIGS
jgi:hypothetical protein